MKTFFQKNALFSLLFFACIFYSKAQNDVILKTDGEEMVGKVETINPDDITFSYKNESVIYTFPKQDILKITFSSGRIQFFNKNTQQSAEAPTNLGDHYNKVAILPFAFIKDQGNGSDAMTEKIQKETFDIFSKNAIQMKFQDVKTTNNLLANAGVNNQNKNKMTTVQLCNILGVEYIIQGTVDVEKSSVSDVSSTSYNSQSKTSNNDKIGNLWGVTKASALTVGSSVQNYSSNINMEIYNDKGNSIFSQEHQSFWLTEDAYKVTLNFLAKRSPLYKH